MDYILFGKYTKFRLIKEFISLIFIRGNLKKLSKLNELKDYSRLLKENDNDLKELHYKINIIRLKKIDNNISYDYGQGYFYQSIPDVKISGYRDTSLRVKKLNLIKLLKQKSVLDIGSNTGAILFNVRKVIKCGVGVEYNSNLIEISNLIKKYLKAKNIKFIQKYFEDFSSNQKFDIILSLANHKTFDGNTKQSIHQYFSKIKTLLKKNGRLIFESHPTKIENPKQREEVLKNIEIFFKVKTLTNVKLPGFLDKDRLYLICSLKNNKKESQKFQ